jgi:hypothetical protein
MYFDKVSISMSLELSTLQPLYDVDPMNSKHMMFNRLKGDDAVSLPLVYHLHRGHLLGPPGDMGVTSFSTSVVLSTVILSPLLPGSTHIFMLSSYHNVTSLMITCATRVIWSPHHDMIWFYVLLRLEFVMISTNIYRSCRKRI